MVALRSPFFLPFALLPLLAPRAAANTWYVDADVPLGGDGTSWSRATKVLEKALTAAMVGDEVWVAEGTYHPILRTDRSDPRSATFLVPQAVAVYGGFDGTETSLAQRAGLFATTVLSGELGVVGDPSDDAYHVVTVNNPSGIPPGWTRLDGFTVRDGNADLPGGGVQGGGVFSFNSALIVADCIVTHNSAMQGAAFHAQPGSLRLLRCTVTDNHALSQGGALWGHVLNVLAVHCTFARNSSDAKGGAIYLHSMASAEAGRFVNSLFYENSADTGGAVFLGGGMYASGKATFQSCTFTMNGAVTAGGGLKAVSGATIPAISRLYDCIVWRNSAPQGPGLDGDHTVSHCDVQGGAAGTNNIALDPRFVDVAARDFRLSPSSPCIDAGDNGAVPADALDVDGDGDVVERLPLDLAGQPRFVDDPATPDTGTGSAPLVDLGAFERQ